MEGLGLAAAVAREHTFRIAVCAMCIADDRATIVETNQAFEQLLGALRGRSIGSLFLDERARDDASSRLRRAMAGERVVFEGLCPTLDGTRLLSWSCRGADRLLVAAIEDASDRERLSGQLALKTAELGSVLQALPDLYFRLDSDARIVAWHAQDEGELHVPPESFIGRRPQDVVPPDIAPIIAAAVARARSERGLVVVEYTLPTPSGDDQFEARLVPCADAQIVAIIRNITARHRAELALRASEEKLRASQKMEALGRLAGGVAHDFNNLLTVIGGRLELLGREAGMSESARAHGREALAAAGQASSLTRQLLALSRRQVLQPSVVDLNGVVSEMHGVLRRLVGEHISFVLSLDETIGTVCIDRSQIEQVILNLVVNARDAMPRGGVLTLSTRELDLDEVQARQRDAAGPGRYVVIAVADTGCGMSSDVMAHLFEPFFTTKPRGQGTGLGLATVYGIVKQSGAHLVVRSAPDVGSTFEVCLPVSDEHVSASATIRTETPRASAGGSQQTVLVVEDEHKVRALAAEVLAEAGYVVLSASNGDEALHAMLSHRKPIALLLTDVVMPGLDGRTLAARVAQLQPGVRVLLMSGHDDSGEDDAGVAWPLLEKPFTVQTLLSRVRELLAVPSTHLRSP